jgi:hypothetical protein
MVSAAPLVIAWSACRNVSEDSSNMCTARQKMVGGFLRTVVRISTRRSPQRPLLDPPVRGVTAGSATDQPADRQATPG